MTANVPSSQIAHKDTPRPKLNTLMREDAKRTVHKTEQFSKEFTEYLAKSPREGDLGDQCECHCCCWWWK